MMKNKNGILTILRAETKNGILWRGLLFANWDVLLENVFHSLESEELPNFVVYLIKETHPSEMGPAGC